MSQKTLFSTYYMGIFMSCVGELNRENEGIPKNVVEAAGESTIWWMENVRAILYGERGAWREEFTSRNPQKQMNQI